MSKYNEIFGADWVRVLKPFLQSEEWQILRTELKEASKGKIYPHIDDIFRAFKLCPYNELMTVFLTTNPYDVQNDGLAFSTSTTGMDDNPKVLDCIFDAVQADYPYCNQYKDSDLGRWAQQGVLLLNCDLTTVKGKPGAHLQMWHPMMKHIFKYLGQYNTGIIYVLIGTHAHKFSQYIIPENNDIFKLEHPMVAVKEKRAWDHKNVFKRINDIGTFLNNRSVDWSKNINKWALQN